MMMMMNEERNNEVGRVIWSQIKMAVGAREAVVSNEGLHFRVGGRSFQKIVVKYDAGSDLYNVSLIKIARRTYAITTLAELEGVFCDQLDTVIYDMVHGIGHFTRK